MPGIPNSASGSEDKFNLTSENQSFTDRSKDIFSLLDTIEKKHDADESAKRSSERRPSTSPHRSQNREQTVSSDSESHVYGSSRYGEGLRSERVRSRSPVDGFKMPYRPRVPLHQGRPRFTADHRNHPERWTRYDLSDVSADQMSDQSNTSAAFSFLNERRQMREDKEKASMAVAEDPERKVVFNKPSQKMKTDDTVESTSSTSLQYSNVHVMEEYVVGQSKKQKKSKTSHKKSEEVSRASCSKIDLEYLEDDGTDEKESGEIKVLNFSHTTDEELHEVSKNSDVKRTESFNKETDDVESKPQGFKTMKHKKKGIRSRTLDDTD